MKEIKKETVFMHGVILLLILINPLITYFVVDYKIENLSNDVIKKYLAIEYNKVGGMDNYVKINDVTRQQAEAWVEQLGQQTGQQGAATENDGTNQAYQAKTLSTERVSTVVFGSKHVLGNSDASITVIEYSDMECPYCKKFHESGVNEQILNDYSNDVNLVFKQFPLNIHPGAQMQAEAALCVGDISGTDTYYQFITKVFKESKQNGNSFTVNAIVDLAESLGVDKQMLSTCISSSKFKTETQKQMEEGKNIFGIKSTPSSVILNNKTGDWDVLPGAYAYKDFAKLIDYLLSK